MRKSNPEVVIVGAGIAGASLATLLARSGIAATYAALMTTFTDEGRARRGRFYSRMQKGDKDTQMARAAVALGPDRLPLEVFSDQLHTSVLE